VRTARNAESGPDEPSGHGWLYAVTLQLVGMLSLGGYAAALVVSVTTPLDGTEIGLKEAT